MVAVPSLALGEWIWVMPASASVCSSPESVTPLPLRSRQTRRVLKAASAAEILPSAVAVALPTENWWLSLV